MQIEIFTENATQLKNNIFEAVRNGTLGTYEIRTTSEQEILLTPVGNQFIGIVLLRFQIDLANNLVIHPTHFTSITRPSNALYAIVIGMISTALITHFSTQFSSLLTTP